MTQLASSGQPQPADALPQMRYRLALDLGTTSLGWAMIRLNHENQPCAVIRAGVRIFSDGRRPKDKASLAVARREARAMRRRRDRLLRRKNRLMQQLIAFGFFPADQEARQSLTRLNPFELRARGLDEPLTGPEFARALFHLNQRRGFKSNRRTDRKQNDAGPLKAAIAETRKLIGSDADASSARTVGELLWFRMRNGMPVRARYRQTRVPRPDGKTGIDKRYDLYVDRAMVEAEFDALWTAQAARQPALYTDVARAALRDTLLYQRNLRPVVAGRCTLLPEESRAPLALPSAQRFRIYQEVNNLRIIDASLQERPLTLPERNLLTDALERRGKVTFTQMRKLLQVASNNRFNLEDAKRSELKGNTTSLALGHKELLGDAWYSLGLARQDAVVRQLVAEESETALQTWLVDELGVSDELAERMSQRPLADGYSSLSSAALDRVLPHLVSDVISFAEAARRAGFRHSQMSPNQAVPGMTFEIEGLNIETGEVRNWHVFRRLPYYGEVLQRHVGFGSGNVSDSPERRYGKIANPTVHIGLNQVRVVVNALIDRYGHPREVVVEVARELKQSEDERRQELQRQAEHQKRNDRLRHDAATVLGSVDRVTREDLQKLILWEELSDTVMGRCCPYSGQRIGLATLLSDQVEIEHILPFSQTLDDSLHNKTVAFRRANRIKGNRTPWEARGDFEREGWRYEDILERAGAMPRQKRYRFGEHGYLQWLREDKDFLARALNDTRYLSRVAREYVSLICPQATRVIPGRMTALLRGKFGLNTVLGVTGAKNRDDHRHHAVDACVLGVTDQGMLQRFAQTSARTAEQHLNRLVEQMPLPWDTYREHVERAVSRIWVSHRPDHNHEGAMHDATAYGLRPHGIVLTHKWTDGIRERQEKRLTVIPMSEPGLERRHGLQPDGQPQPYKGYNGNSNYCIEIVREATGRWRGEVVSTYEAYQAVRRSGGVPALRNRRYSLRGNPLVMRLMINDTVRLEEDGQTLTMRVVKLKTSGQIVLAATHEANVDARNGDANDGFSYRSKTAGTLQNARGRQITVSPVGDIHDRGFQP